MHYFSTSRTLPNATFRDAVLNGQPPDKGLYFPSEIPKLSPGFLRSLCDRPNEEIACEVIRPYVGGEIPDEKLFEICRETVNFDFPLVEISDRIAVLELFHGPTLAFKDVGARFMSKCLGYFLKDKNRKTVVIVATSGDTGGAVAAGFHGIEGVTVVILYPKGKVSRVQELQLTTFGGNVITLELRGTFDDCQQLAKTALADPDIQGKVDLTSANSINVARWLPQQFYYFFALKRWDDESPVICVPSGNFGNIAAGILANVSGCPIKRFIAASNANDIVPRYFESGEFEVRPTIETLSNAMDVGNPSNFVRILELLHSDLKERLCSVSINDEDTATTIRSVFEKYNYTLDPHGAVAYKALADYLTSNPTDHGIFLETAHPVKFDSVGKILGTEIPKPPAVAKLEEKTKTSIEIDADYDALKEILLSRI